MSGVVIVKRCQINLFPYMCRIFRTKNHGQNRIENECTGFDADANKDNPGKDVQYFQHLLSTYFNFHNRLFYNAIIINIYRKTINLYYLTILQQEMVLSLHRILCSYAYNVAVHR